MRPIVAISALFTSVMLLAGSAAADDGAKPADTHAGANAKDRTVTLSQFVERATKRMKSADTNKDGVLTKEELASQKAKRPAKDGQHQKDGEHKKDGDHKKGEAHAPKAGKDGKAGHAAHAKRPSFEELDANKDGQVSVAEVEASAKQRFAELDKDKDGQLTKSELPRLGKHGRKHHGDSPEGGRKGRAPAPSTDA